MPDNTIGEANIKVKVSGTDDAKKEIKETEQAVSESTQKINNSFDDTSEGAERLKKKLAAMRVADRASALNQRSAQEAVNKVLRDTEGISDDVAIAAETAFAKASSEANEAAASTGDFGRAASYLQETLSKLAIPAAVATSIVKIFNHFSEINRQAVVFRESLQDIGEQTDRATQALAAQARGQPEGIRKQIDQINSLRDEIKALEQQYDELSKSETAAGAYLRGVQQLYTDEDITRTRKLDAIFAQIQDKQDAIRQRVQSVRDIEAKQVAETEAAERTAADARRRSVEAANELLEVDLLRRDTLSEESQIAAADIARKIEGEKLLQSLYAETDASVQDAIRAQIKLVDERAAVEIAGIQAAFEARREAEEKRAADEQKRQADAEAREMESIRKVSEAKEKAHRDEMNRIAQQKRAVQDLSRAIEDALNVRGTGIFGASSIDNLTQELKSLNRSRRGGIFS